MNPNATWFSTGLDRGIALWRAGYTAESISHAAEGKRAENEHVANGMLSVSDIILGWTDAAERRAVLTGFSRDAALTAIADAGRALDSLFDKSPYQSP